MPVPITFGSRRSIFFHSSKQFALDASFFASMPAW